MPVTLPNLDDRKYADLIEEALAMIPAHAPEWTNHNPADPGITLVELFAYLTEMLIYRLNRVTVENVVAFLNLIDAGNRTPDQYRDRARLTEEVRKVVLELRKPYRAITPDDFNEAVIKDFSEEVARAFTTVEKKPRFDKDEVDFISVFVVPVPLSTVLVQRGERYSDHSSDLRTPGNIAFQLVSEPEEYLYIGMQSPFDAIRFHLDVPAPHYKLTFEYFKGGGDATKPKDKSQWATLTEKEHQLADLTSNWTSSGLVVFEPPADWKASSSMLICTKPMYWLRVSAEKPPTNKADATAFQVAVYSVPVLPPDYKSDRSLAKRIKKDLDTRRLLATRVDVTGPIYKRVTVRNITLHLKPDAREEDILKAAKEELSRFFHPLIGGRDGKGWPFGRAIYLSEIIERLVGLPGVDFVENEKGVGNEKNPLQIISPLTGQKNPQTSESINLLRFELVDFRVTDSQSDPMFKTQSALDPHSRKQPGSKGSKKNYAK